RIDRHHRPQRHQILQQSSQEADLSSSTSIVRTTLPEFAPTGASSFRLSPLEDPPTLSVTMSLVSLAHVCSHLQNASKARLGLTSIPSTNLHLTLAHALQKQGFLSSVTRAGPTPPAPEMIADPSSSPEAEVTQANIASRRLWLGLKYWNNEPVLRKMWMVSKPTKRIWLNHHDLGVIVRGREAGYVKGMTNPGECLFVSTDRGVLEARECVERRIGGMMLCRAL
ncbi:hypothetical protein LTR04_003665, partial [Oleoguttula sp. CCFEE 6159]